MINTTLCYIEQDGKYLMLHRIKKKEDINAGKWIGVGGKFEPGETADECVVREVFEETGLTLTRYERVGLVKFVSDTYEAEDMYLYRGTDFTGALKEDCPEGELRWVPMEDVSTLPAWEGDKYFLKALFEHRKNINMTVRYEGDVLVEFRDDTATVEVEKSALLKATHGFSTRLGGVSDSIFDSLNLGRNRGDIPERVNENWRRFLEKCGESKANPKGQFSDYRVVWGKQVHENYVHIATEEDLRGFDESKAPLEADGYVTNVPGVPLAVFTADCVPVLLQDAMHGVIGAVHSGWRSTVADIAGRAVQKMLSLGAEVSDICVAIGPAIDSCCFEVGPEVVAAVDELLGEAAATRFYHPKGKKTGPEFTENQSEAAKYMLDLRGVVRERFLQLGVLPQNIELVGGCTMCHPERYWSHRYTNGQRGSQAAVIMM